ncbi:MAG TPA: hypothetical protein VM470_05010 [Acidimicrobiia bacterium]|nr:hypothetical protein [Acidimicrobiia bacterium]
MTAAGWRAAVVPGVDELSPVGGGVEIDSESEPVDGDVMVIPTEE